MRHAAFASLIILLTASSLFASEASSRQESKCIGESEIEPRSAERERFSGRDAGIFLQKEQDSDTHFFDSVIVLSGANVWGGIAVILFKQGCAVGEPGFLSVSDYFDRLEMVELFRENASLKSYDYFDNSKVLSLARAGEPAAQFHMGIRSSREGDRASSIDWFTKAAKGGSGPAMLELGTALSDSEHSDSPTDRAMAYFWLNQASNSIRKPIRYHADDDLRRLLERMSPTELSKGRQLILEHESPSLKVRIQDVVSLGRARPEVIAATDKEVLKRALIEARSYYPKLRGPVQTTVEQLEAEQERLIQAQKDLSAHLSDLESKGDICLIPYGSIARVVRSGVPYSQVELLSGKLKGKVAYVESDEIAK